MRRLSTSLRARTAVLAGLLGTLMLTSACGGGTSATGTTSASTLDSVSSAVEAAYTGTDRPLPTTGPAIKPDQNLWIVSCSQGAPGCATPTLALQEAAQSVGWDVTVADGKLDFSTYSTLIRQAIAAKADAIVLVAIDCGSVQQPLTEAKAAGVTVYGLLSFDCDDPTIGAEPLFTASLGLGGADASLATYLESLGETAANYIIDKTDGKAEVVEIYEDDVLFDKYVGQGFETAMKACEGCSFERVTIVAADYAGSAVQSKAAAGVARQPNANAIFAPVDALITLGVGQAARSAKSGTILAGIGGLQPNVEQIAGDGPQTFAAGLPFTRIGWATLDDLNRILSGEEQVDQGIGTQAIDKEHNLPIDPDYYDGNVDGEGRPTVDYVSAYKALWKVS
ncbi:sugar ABC transporter substrate-binding protein [Nocardioides flavescens]|uniref:Substrate-binding domain-containing protein n=1 Tax=Nocardioides flavescens TaxID=2691959 RepID=A0A6L7EU79_9ACTN|nr:substrate-binding domain-containing protein [Nocardioides flavescens]MXG89018.1 substrate-binding domain-containing protein [Nocardioides flavescens]